MERIIIAILIAVVASCIIPIIILAIKYHKILKSEKYWYDAYDNRMNQIKKLTEEVNKLKLHPHIK